MSSVRVSLFFSISQVFLFLVFKNYSKLCVIFLPLNFVWPCLVSYRFISVRARVKTTSLQLFQISNQNQFKWSCQCQFVYVKVLILLTCCTKCSCTRNFYLGCFYFWFSKIIQNCVLFYLPLNFVWQCLVSFRLISVRAHVKTTSLQIVFSNFQPKPIHVIVSVSIGLRQISNFTIVSCQVFV